jgi:NAD(P)-dependent dehydrogenase (short-subunit alcohol dehydrogenase family)
VYDFSGKVAIVTGAATGLGEAIAVRLSDQGAAVVVAGRDEKGGRAVADRLDPSGQRATAIVADVRDHLAMKNLVDRTVERFGALHFAVNNAGITGPHGIAVPD